MRSRDWAQECVSSGNGTKRYPCFARDLAGRVARRPWREAVPTGPAPTSVLPLEWLAGTLNEAFFVTFVYTVSAAVREEKMAQEDQRFERDAYRGSSVHGYAYAPGSEEGKRQGSRLTGGVVVLALAGVAFAIAKGFAALGGQSALTNPASARVAVSAEFSTAIALPPTEWSDGIRAVLDAGRSQNAAQIEQATARLARLVVPKKQLSAEQRSEVRALNARGLDAYKADRPGDAAMEFHKAYSIDASDPEVVENLGFMQLKMTRYDEAANTLSHALRVSPRRASAWINMALALAGAGKADDAVASWEVGSRLSKAPAKVRAGLAKAYEEDASPEIRAAAGRALAQQVTKAIDPALESSLGTLSMFRFTGLLPSRLRGEDALGSAYPLYIPAAGQMFSVEASETSYSIPLANEDGCALRSCVIGRIEARSADVRRRDGGKPVQLTGGVAAEVLQGAGGEGASVMLERAGVTYEFAMPRESEAVALANSALQVEAIPMSIFVERRPGAVAAVGALPAALNAVPSPATSPATAPAVGSEPVLTAQQIYAQASRSVVVVVAAQGQGSGVAVEPGVVLTNCHVVKEGGQLGIAFGGRRYPASLVSSHSAMDFCVLEVPGLPAAPAVIRRVSDVTPGQRVYSVGAPRGLDLTIADGLISGIRTLAIYPLPMIQTTAPISPGSSGGGLFDETGRLVGLTTMYRKDSQNLNFAVPAELYFLPPQAAAAASPQTTTALSPGWTASPPPGSRAQPDCDIAYSVQLETIGEGVLVELRAGYPGRSQVERATKTAGGTVRFDGICPGPHFFAIGNSESVQVGPVRQLETGVAYTGRIVMQRGSGNMERRARASL